MKFKMLFMLALFSASVASAKILDVDDIVAMERNNDGTYTVECLNGRVEESVTLEQIQANQVCAPLPSNIVYVERQDDGTFKVWCADGTELFATAEELRSGQVCQDNTPVRAPVLAGDYKVRESDVLYYVELDKESNFAGWLVEISWADDQNDIRATFRCGRGETFCKGEDEDGKRYGLMIASLKSFAVTDEDGGNAVWLEYYGDQAP